MELRPITDEEAAENEGRKLSVIEASAKQIADIMPIARFRGRPIILIERPFPHFEPLHKEKFEQLAYPRIGGVTRSRISDLFAFMAATATDFTGSDHLIMFGLEGKDHQIWDMRELKWVDAEPNQAIWRSQYAPVEITMDDPLEFVMQLAGGDQELYDDIFQSLAPLVMEKKPDGVIWWVGDGANGKSTLMDAIYKIFPGQLSSINVKRLTDGRDTPSLNGTLANVVKESSEGRIDDTEIYKAIGTHENFRVHKFHSQDDMEIRGNLHHIFSANSIPAFNDKGFSARRRTFIVPFRERFASDPTFEKRVFQPEMFGRLIAEMCRYAQKIRDQGYRYKWSAITLSAKEEYDTEANSAEEYAKTLIADGAVGFESFNPVRIDYENWCADNGYVPLGVGNLRRAVQAAGFERMTARIEGGGTAKRYKLPNVDARDMVTFSLGRPGFYTATGFRPAAPEPADATVPSFHEPREPQDIEEAPSPRPLQASPPEAKSGDIIGGKW